MPRGQRDYLGKTEGAVFIQGRVPKEMGNKVKEILEREGMSWAKFLKASCAIFIAETERRDGKSKKPKSPRRVVRS